VVVELITEGLLVPWEVETALSFSVVLEVLEVEAIFQLAVEAQQLTMVKVEAVF